MLLKSLTVRNFRNLSTQTIPLSTKIQFFMGDNGQGKTSLLEAAGFLVSLKSIKNAKPEDCIREGEESCSVSGEVESKGLTLKCELEFLKTGSGAKKRALQNGKLIGRRSDYVHRHFGETDIKLHCVSFNPSDHALVTGEPEVRRRYLDRLISAEDPEFSELAIRQQKVTDQRNSILKKFVDERAPINEASFDAISEQWISLSAEVVSRRRAWIQEQNLRLQKNLNKLTSGTSSLALLYQTKNANYPGHDPVHPIEFFKEFYGKQLREMGTLERKHGSTQIGPGRDDWVLMFNGQSLKHRGSQGEIRSALIALKLSEVESYRERSQQAPLFVLDDFSSELDRFRRSFLMQWLVDSGLQVLVSATDVDLDTQNVSKVFKVQQGTVYDHGVDYIRS